MGFSGYVDRAPVVAIIVLHHETSTGRGDAHVHTRSSRGSRPYSQTLVINDIVRDTRLWCRLTFVVELHKVRKFESGFKLLVYTCMIVCLPPFEL